MSLLTAVLETSFWTAAHRADVAANCLDLFEMVVPRAVETEIRQSDPRDPRIEYPYTTLFRHLRSRMIDPPVPEPAPIPVFGVGEAAAIALAADLQVPLLVNEHRAAGYARRLGIRTIAVPDVVVVLRSRGTISDRAARRKLELIVPITAGHLIEEARVALRAL
jgi:predicted nucleic acid-binding protein